MNTKKIKFFRLRVLYQAFRYHFVPPSFLPAILGGVVAWTITGKFHILYFIVTVLGVTINHIALNMTDDYYDYKHSVDRIKDRGKNPYSGGSGTLTDGLIKPDQMRRAFIIGYFITICLGLYLTAMRGWMVFVFGIFGIGCAYFYTAPPIRYGYRGWGEISQLINFSITIGLGSFYVQVQQLSWQALCALLPLGFMMFSMIIINEIPDEEDDRLGEKNNLVVRFGVKAAVWLYGISMVIAYIIIIVSPLITATSYFIYLSLVTFPWFTRAFNILLRNYRDAQKMSPANMLTIRIHNITGILLIIGYFLQGILNHQHHRQMWIPLIILVVLYSPVALTIFSNLISLRLVEKHA